MGGMASLILDAAIYVALFLVSFMAGLFLACLLTSSSPSDLLYASVCRGSVKTYIALAVATAV
jgi:membrane protein YqaA with SNARE-associated domain